MIGAVGCSPAGSQAPVVMGLLGDDRVKQQPLLLISVQVMSYTWPELISMEGRRSS